MNPAKIQLSPKEMDLVTNPDWILTKNGIIQKVKYILESLALQQQEYISAGNHQLPDEVMLTTAKISKGENYLGLPYLILDHPRYFNRHHIAAIRTLFWWGNFFSTTLHLSGTYQERWKENIKASYDQLEKDNFQISVHATEWEHHFEKTNYVAVKELGKTGFQKQIEEHAFIKLATKISLENWVDAEKILFESFKRLLGILKV